MEHLLFAAAEQQELDQAQAAYSNMENELRGKVEVDFMLTGVGAVSTAYRLTQKIMEAEAEGHPYHLLIDIGIAGSYDLAEYPVGTAAVVSREYFGDLGFDTPEGFVPLFQYDVVGENDEPYTEGAICRHPLPYKKLETLISTWQSATGVTIQTITSDRKKVRDLQERFHGGVESMEGAAFYYIARLEHIPFFELRTVSNEVGESDSSRWETPKALQRLKVCCQEILATWK